jgi:hypothetical protein
MTSGGAERCAGCGRPREAVGKLLPARAPGVSLAICDSCVEECVQAIADSPTRIPGKSRFCSFCHKPEGSVAVTLVVGNELICDECVDAFRSPS